MGAVLDLPCPSGILWLSDSVITFQMKLDYLRCQLANLDIILYEGFGTDWLKTLVSMATESAH